MTLASKQNDHPGIENEQGFIPVPAFAEHVRQAADQRLRIVQAYLPREEKAGYLERHLFFEGKTPGHLDQVGITFSAAGKTQLTLHSSDPDKIAGLSQQLQSDPSFMIKKGRFRVQQNIQTGEVSTVFCIKGKRGHSSYNPEFEFEVPPEQRPRAFALMRDYCQDKMILKTRSVKHGVFIGGKNRKTELDDFQGAHAGKCKLEIEHEPNEVLLTEPVWREFATQDVTHDTSWRNYKMAGPDAAALRVLAEIAEQHDSVPRGRPELKARPVVR